MKNWGKRIIGNKIDLQGAPLYTPTFDKKTGPVVKVYGYDCLLPTPPPDEEFINYGLPADDQVFRKTVKPASLNLMKPEDQEAFIQPEYHRRRNGVWIFINGKRYYFPGIFYYFLNYWNLKSGEEVLFRITDLHFFLMWMLCLRDPKCLGLIDFKCRQIGDTEKVLCIIYEFATRFRSLKCAMQSINEDHIKKSFKRLVFAHRKMDWFMKPQNKGSDNPEGGFIFEYPSTIQSNVKNKKQFQAQGTSSIQESELLYEHPAIESEIQYGPSDEHHFDGQTWNLYYMDEFGKMERMDPIKTLGVIKPAMVSRILNKILGKILMTSTVEELKSGKSLKWAKKLWAGNNPEERMPNGMTKYGLYRIFRSALDRAPVDKFGFPKVEEERKKIKDEMKSFLDSNDMSGLIDFRRKNPITIDDVFLSAQNESGFHIENLVSREIQLMSQRVKKEVFGNLKWKDGIQDSEVIWEPNPRGRWSISLHPSEHGFDNGAQQAHSLTWRPALIHAFAMGVDPYDQKTNIENDISDGGIVVRRRYDGNYDGAKFDERGKPEMGGMFWETERVVCDYRYRHQNPIDFYEDVILTAVYFGTQFLFEKNKGGGLEAQITTRGYSQYIQEQPRFTRSNKAANMDLVGITATENSVNQAFELLQTESCDYPNTIHHTRYLGEMLRMNWDNRGENDIGMAGGWAKVASLRLVAPRKNPEEEKKLRYYAKNYV